MSPRLAPRERRGLLTPESPTESSFDLEDANDRLQNLRYRPAATRGSRLLPESFRGISPFRLKRLLLPAPRTRASRSLFHRLTLLLRWALVIVLALFVFTGIFRPSYTYRPSHYNALTTRIKTSTEVGRGNPSNEKIFISISLYDRNGHLASGKWGQLLIDVIDLLGHDNVFLSIYENDSGEAAAEALQALKAKIPCQHEIVSDLGSSREDFPNVTLQDGSTQLKRITYLAEMRNRALRPLDNASGPVYDKVLILNDIFYHPSDVAQLLFSTNAGKTGKADYLAACAIDFEPVFKFYDSYATRDLDGYSMGYDLFYPWFSTAGRAQSRQDMLDQKDAVRVKSCWGGMVALDAKYMQSSKPVVDQGSGYLNSYTISPTSPRPVSAPIRFRAEPEVYYDACECCLILADLQQVAKRPNSKDDSGVYMNPYIRVAYGPTTLWWVDFVRRFERLYDIPHRITTFMSPLPTYNPVRMIEEGQQFNEEVWVPDSSLAGNGSWQVTTRLGRSGMFCGVRAMQVLRKAPRQKDKNWRNTPIPAGGHLW